MRRLLMLGHPGGTGMHGLSGTEALFGAVGFNTGNLAFIEALQGAIADPVQVVPWHASPEVLASGEAILIPCANQLGPHSDLGGLARNLRQAGRPVVAIGLGAQSASTGTPVELTPGTADWVAALHAARFAGHQPNIFARGPFTVAQLARFGVPDAVPGGCPSLFLNPASDLGRRIAAHWEAVRIPRALAVAGGHEQWAGLRGVEQQLAALLQDPRCPGIYVVQSGLEMVQAARGDFEALGPEAEARLRDYLLPHLAPVEFKAWCRTQMRAFFGVPAWVEALRGFDLTIGPRYHGVALALQAERMGVTITIDSRTAELCAETGVPSVPAGEIARHPITREGLKRMIRFDAAAYDRNRLARARMLRDFLRGNGLTPSRALEALAAAEMPAAA